MTPDEEQRLRDRLHKLADMVFVHEGQLGEHNVLLTSLGQQVEALKATVATKEHVDAAVSIMSLKLDHLVGDVAPIKRGIAQVVWLILSVVILAVLGLVLLRPGG